MQARTRVRTQGGSVVITLPKVLLTDMGVVDGDTLLLETKGKKLCAIREVKHGKR